MMDSGLLLVATLAFPLAMVVACLHPAFYARILTWLPLAAVPGLLAALFERGDSIVIAPAPLRLTLALDEVGAMLLGGASLLWGAAGFYASISMCGRPGAGRFAIWWLLTLTGSLGVFIVADMTSFYLVFSLASLAAYGLVSFEGTARAQRAGFVYMALALLGEALILLGFVMLVTAAPGGNPLIRDAVAMLPDSPLESPAVLLLILGFGLKMGLLPLHVWMPLAHPVAPVPASAVLSGVIVKAGVIGLIRFLPLEVPSPDWGMALVGLGLITAFYGVLVGLTQSHAKTILAYSTVSQMGVVAAIIGGGMTTGAPHTAVLAAFYALHHLLVKGALFLGVGIAGATGRRHYVSFVLIPMALLSLSLAGLPFTSGALAKLATKPLFGDGVSALLASLSAAGSTMLMLHFLGRLQLLANDDHEGIPQRPLMLVWAVVAGASFIVPWALFANVSGYALADAIQPDALWAASWPILLGATLTLITTRFISRMPTVPEGDIIVVLDKLAPLVMRIGSGIDRTDEVLRRWPVASIGLLSLAIAFGTVLQFGR
ncbi:MAG: complex I subunit 5 family protein [Hyphomicrobium sp.]|nr:complex I subunit 5 family protein [Hyphomicrobium sp.]